MSLSFQSLPYGAPLPSQASNLVLLIPDNWDDYGYKTLFSIFLFDNSGKRHDLGHTKVGFCGQNEGWTSSHIPERFFELPDNFFSLGQDADFYKTIFSYCSSSTYTVEDILSPIRDVSFDDNNYEKANSQNVFRISLLRSVDQASITQQFKRIINDQALLSSYSFTFNRSSSKSCSGIELHFQTTPNTEPPTNIHILIGRNGVGKTTILNQMVDSLVVPNNSFLERPGTFTQISSSSLSWFKQEIPDDYFAGVVSVSFSAFDTFTPPNDQIVQSSGIRYRYVGLKKSTGEGVWGLKDNFDLGLDCANSLKVCLALKSKRLRWLDAVKTLKSDPNFAEMPLEELVSRFDDDTTPTKDAFEVAAKHFFSRMSSGHSIVLLTITSLIETVEEKTLVLIDEPESHLHPPLLAAFTRALSNLLSNRNGIAIVATHSPVVLQEVPRSCVSIINRSRLYSRVDKPAIETFAENVGALTREVFELEVDKSGYHQLLEESVRQGETFDSIMDRYSNQIGFEGKAILRSMLIKNRR
ncbi:TPA: AAA family ATPase [Photobacterium damselae]